MDTQFNTQGYRSGHLLALVAAVLLGIGAVVKFFFVILHGFQIGGVLGGPNAVASGTESVSLAAALNAILLLLNFLVYVATIVAFLMWLHRVVSNLRSLGAQRTEYSPGLAVGSFFIPFANLVWPYKAMREVWRWSKPLGESEEIVGLSFTADTSAPLVGWWWGLWLASNFISNAYWRVSDQVDMAGAIPWLGLFADLSSIAAAALAIMVVLSIDRMQTERSKQLALRGAEFEQPPPPPTFGAQTANFS